METMDLDLVRVFVKVIQNGSFSRAAELMHLPKSTVSKAVTRLEKETGTRLLLRTTRSLTLTPAGRAFYDTCLGPLQTIEDAQKSLYGQDSILSGSVKITAPEDLGNEVIAPALAELARKHPALTFEMIFTDEVIDLVKQGFDLAVRIGRLNESGLKAKKIGEVTLVPVASPAYLQPSLKIQHPKDLLKHDLLSLHPRASRLEWHLRSKKESIRVPVKPRVTSNQMSSLLRAAAAGGGVAFVPAFICRREIAAGQLLRVVPEWAGNGMNVSLISPLSLSSAARLKLVGDHLFSAIQRALGSI
jgi:DNA-binding transcriptional LysR family regulator